MAVGQLTAWPLLVLVAASPGARMRQVSPAELCVTEGAVRPGQGAAFSVETPKMRAVVPGGPSGPSSVVQLDFELGGETVEQKALGSGEVRRQLGLKLRAQDACNLLYVMWRPGPPSELVVSAKENPGQHTSAECGNRGYRTLHRLRAPPLVAGSRHVLRAELDGDTLRLWVDGRPVWSGGVGPLVFDGPVGMRSDNVRFVGRLSAGGASVRGAPRGCPSTLGGE